MGVSGGVGTVPSLWLPSNQNLLGWSIDPATAVNASNLPDTGTVQTAKVSVQTAGNCTGATVFAGTAGVGLTAGENFAGLYNAAGALLATTADLSAIWAGTGALLLSWTAPLALAPGIYTVGLVCNAATSGPLMSRGVSGALVNVGLTAPNSRFGTANAAQIAMPANLTALAASSLSWFVGLY